ncbi:MAG: peptidyl-prolyl cis-trans isomerase [Bacteroidia bacterium]|nr:peptidyl-prolyl cis-trans isomerase [Bacteroidia bacterium]
MKYLFIFLFCGGLCTSVQAQSPKDTVLVVDKETVELLQLLHPRFFYSPDSSVFASNLQKYLLQDMILCEEQRATLEKDSALNQRYARFMELAALHFWANEIRKNSVKQEPGETEIRQYYEAHRENFRTPYVFTFYQAWTPGEAAGSDEAVKELQRRLKLWKQGNPDAGKMQLGQTALNLEQRVGISTDNPLYPLLLKTGLMEVSEPFTVGTHTVYIALTERSGGEVMPYESVRENCRQQVLNLKMAEQEQNMRIQMERITLINNVK